MARSFTWERGPFERCDKCGQQTFGLLSAGDDVMNLRCSNCRFGYSAVLPDLDKRVVYLDQNAFSVLFKVRSKGRLPIGHEAFSTALYEKVRRAVLLQQVVMPHSDIHSQETIVFSDAQGLRKAYEFIGGDVSLKSHHDIALEHVCEFADAYRDGREPKISFDVNDILKSKLNVWLPDMHISVGANYAGFAGGIRHTRAETHTAMTQIIERWQREKPTFESVLEAELACFGTAKVQAFAANFERMVEADVRGDFKALMDGSFEPILREKMMVQRVLKLDGADEGEVLKAVGAFWMWERNREQPVHFISSHLFAGMARRFALGQKSASRGMSNDITAIATYGPYMDAMFVDKEFASLLRETKQLRGLPLKARIFSFANGDDFLSYLDELAANASDETREYANRIYGVR